MKTGKEKKIIMTPTKARELQEQIYWELLEQFLAAAADLNMITEDQIEDFAARVNWYFSAQHNEKTINEKMVHSVIEAKIGLIMERTKHFSQSLDINLMPPEQPAAAPAPVRPAQERPLRAFMVSCKNEDGVTVVFAETANEARAMAKYSEMFDYPEYTRLHAVRFPQLDGYAKRKREMDWSNAKDVKAAKAAGIVFGEVQ